MAKNAVYTVKYRRKREGRTHYKKRLELLKSNKIRLVIRRSNTSVLFQFVEYDSSGDKVLLTFNSKKLIDFGWKYSTKSLPATYLAGLAAGVMAKKKGITEAILDLGLQTPASGSKLYAGLKGIVDAGISIPCSEDVFPSEERISGQHIAALGDLAKQCTKYAKESLSVESIPDVFDSIKKKILA